jgi:hypothetical protein
MTISPAGPVAIATTPALSTLCRFQGEIEAQRAAEDSEATSGGSSSVYEFDYMPHSGQLICYERAVLWLALGWPRRVAQDSELSSYESRWTDAPALVVGRQPSPPSSAP